MSTLRVNNLKSRTGTAVTITSGHSLDVQGNLNVKLVSKYWYKKINTVKFWKDYSKSLFYTLVNSNNERKTI